MSENHQAQAAAERLHKARLNHLLVTKEAGTAQG